MLVVTGERKERKEGNNLDIYSPVKYNAGQLIEYLETTIKRFSTLHHYITRNRIVITRLFLAADVEIPQMGANFAAHVSGECTPNLYINYSIQLIWDGSQYH